MNKCIFMPSLAAGFLCLLYVGSASAWSIDQTYDDQKDGSGCQGWGFTGSIVTSDESASGAKSCELNIKQGKTAFGEWGGSRPFPSKLYVGDEIWIRIRTFWPNGTNYDSTSEGSNLKFLRIHTRDDVTTNYGYADWYIYPKKNTIPFMFRYEGKAQAPNIKFGSSGDSIVFNVWETYEYYIKFDTKSVDEGGKGIARMWKDGVLIGEITSELTMKKSQGYADLMYIFGYWNGGSPQTQKMYVDDLIITSDVPGNKDSAGNPFIGVGNFTAIAPPNPPTPN